jgi:hypothetical protein
MCMWYVFNVGNEVREGKARIAETLGSHSGLDTRCFSTTSEQRFSNLEDLFSPTCESTRHNLQNTTPHSDTPFLAALEPQQELYSLGRICMGAN